MIAPLLAPVLATLAQNGLGLLADAVTKKGQQVVEETLGIDLSQQPSPDVLAQWKKAVMEHERELIQMVYADKDSARKMQIAALQQKDPFSKRFVYYFAWFWSAVASLYVGFITFGNIPPDNVRFADTILGFILGTVIATIVQFFFGSSMGSQEKNEENQRRLERNGLE